MEGCRELGKTLAPYVICMGHPLQIQPTCVTYAKLQSMHLAAQCQELMEKRGMGELICYAYHAPEIMRKVSVDIWFQLSESGPEWSSVMANAVWWILVLSLNYELSFWLSVIQAAVGLVLNWPPLCLQRLTLTTLWLQPNIFSFFHSCTLLRIHSCADKKVVFIISYLVLYFRFCPTSHGSSWKTQMLWMWKSSH